jgi:hypothetical protein
VRARYARRASTTNAKEIRLKGGRLGTPECWLTREEAPDIYFFGDDSEDITNPDALRAGIGDCGFVNRRWELELLRNSRRRDSSSKR